MGALDAYAAVTSSELRLHTHDAAVQVENALDDRQVQARARAGLGVGRVAGTPVAQEALFLAIWYVAGVARVTLIGAALGPRLLRW
jgi:hypothetical protein